MRLDSKTIIVTGASRGIGKAIARAVLREGGNVVLTSRRKEAAEAVALDIMQGTKGRAVGMACDVKRYDMMSELIERALNEFGRLDVLINNAGSAEPYARIVDQDPDSWYEPIEVNLKGTFNGCKAILPHFLKQGYGKIINMAGSGASFKRSDNTACVSGYAASKAAIRRLTLTLSEEYNGSGVDIMLLNPGMVRTEILGTHCPTPELSKRLDRFILVQDIFAQSPEVAAEMAVKLASSWSDGKNGRYFTVFSSLKAKWLLFTYPYRKWRGLIDRTIY